MMSITNQKFRVFLCHASQDKLVARELYQRLFSEGWIDPWLDEEKLLPGQDWDMEIEKAVEDADAIIVCLSNKSVTKEGYIQRELKFALDIALEKPEGTIFIIPLRLDDCVPPRRLRAWQYVDYYPLARRELAYSRLLKALTLKTNSLNQTSKEEHPSQVNVSAKEHSTDEVPFIKQNTYSPPSQFKYKSERKFSISMIVSILGLIPTPIWLLLGVVGIIIGFFELKSRARTQAITGIILGFIEICLWGFLFYVDQNYLWCTFFPFMSGCS